jgi:hypothetical protein
MKTINNNILVKPVATEGLKTEVRGGMVTVKQMSDIVALEVLFDSETGIKAGSKIFIDEYSLSTEAWGKKHLTIDNKKVMIVPFNKVIAVE